MSTTLNDNPYGGSDTTESIQLSGAFFIPLNPTEFSLLPPTLNLVLLLVPPPISWLGNRSEERRVGKEC